MRLLRTFLVTIGLILLWTLTVIALVFAEAISVSATDCGSGRRKINREPSRAKAQRCNKK